MKNQKALQDTFIKCIADPTCLKLRVVSLNSQTNMIQRIFEVSTENVLTKGNKLRKYYIDLMVEHCADADTTEVKFFGLYSNYGKYDSEVKLLHSVKE